MVLRRPFSKLLSQTEVFFEALATSRLVIKIPPEHTKHCKRAARSAAHNVTRCRELEEGPLWKMGQLDYDEGKFRTLIA